VKRRFAMSVMPPSADFVLQAPAGGSEGLFDGQVQVFETGAHVGVVLHHHGTEPGGQVDRHPVTGSRLPDTSQAFDDHPADIDMPGQGIQFGGVMPDDGGNVPGSMVVPVGDGQCKIRCAADIFFQD